MKTVSGSAQNYANFLLDVGQINACKAATIGFSLSKDIKDLCITAALTSCFL